MSQLVVLEEDLERDRAAFPAHKRLSLAPPLFACGAAQSRGRVFVGECDWQC